jgi:citrate synthase
MAQTAEPAKGQVKNTLSVVDNRTGKTYEIPIEHETIKATDLRQIRVNADDFGMMTYDPAFMNTASCKSTITFIDGDKGILRYRGYPIEQLAEKFSYLEVAYLLVHGELPTGPQLETWKNNITTHTFVHENVKKFMDGFHHDAHPMGMFVSALAALSTFYPSAKKIHDNQEREITFYRLMGKVPTLAAFAYRHSVGMPYVHPDNELSYPGNFLSMMFKIAEPKYKPNPVLEHALDVLFILHADHEQNCSTSAMRGVGSSHVDPYSAAAAAAAALYGPLHG